MRFVHVAGVLAVPLGGDVPAVRRAARRVPQHGEHEGVQQDGVEEDEEARSLVAHRELHERQNDLLEEAIQDLLAKYNNKETVN